MTDDLLIIAVGLCALVALVATVVLVGTTAHALAVRAGMRPEPTLGDRVAIGWLLTGLVVVGFGSVLVAAHRLGGAVFDVVKAFL